MHILGIESSCDDTSVALLKATDAGVTVLAQKTASQIDIHKKYGGVVPEIAGRLHAENIFPVIEAVLTECRTQNVEFRIPDLIAVTAGPGLVTGLVIGLEAAKTLAYLWNIPIVGVNHIEGHILSSLLAQIGEMKKTEIVYPALALVVSGGHTELVVMEKPGTYRIIGKTRDDAAGECFDKVASLIGIPYPGGPQISKLGASGNAKAIDFPRPMLDSGDYDFSFAGLKTSALYYLRDHPIPSHSLPTVSEDFCASFEQAIVDVLVTKTLRAVKEYTPKTILLGGGVSANKKLRESLAESIRQITANSTFYIPHSQFTMDNGAMIAIAGYYQYARGITHEVHSLAADPNWKVDGTNVELRIKN